MGKLIKESISVLSNMNRISRGIIKYGTILIIGIFASAIVLYITAGTLTDYYASMQLHRDLILCGKECISGIYMPALTLEILDIATGKETQNC